MPIDQKGNHRLSRSISRRDFLKFSGAAAAAGLLTGCGVKKPAVSREDAVEFHPDAPRKVVRAHHAGVWEGEELLPDVLRRMLDASIVELTGLKDGREAWSAMFAPDERIAIKVNTLFSQDCTHLPLVLTVVQCLQEAGVPPEQIVIFDARTSHLRNAGYPVNEDGPGVRCHGANYTPGWTIADIDIGLSGVLLNCDALINIPILTGITFFGAGISFAMKNHFGTFDQPRKFHGERFVHGVTEINALSPIRDRTRLIIGDILTPETYRSHYGRLVVGGLALLTSSDPVALDTVGTQIAADAYAAEGSDPNSVTEQAAPWLGRAAELGLGTNDLENFDLVEVDLA
jgi:hypothetical protein